MHTPKWLHCWITVLHHSVFLGGKSLSVWHILAIFSHSVLQKTFKIQQIVRESAVQNRFSSPQNIGFWLGHWSSNTSINFWISRSFVDLDACFGPLSCSKGEIPFHPQLTRQTPEDYAIILWMNDSMNEFIIPSFFIQSPSSVWRKAALKYDATTTMLHLG